MEANLSSADLTGEDSRTAKELVALISDLSPDQIPDVTEAVKHIASDRVDTSSLRFDSSDVLTPKFTAPRERSQSLPGSQQ